jgi:O-antigen/teichoic acid export membrane protein
MKIFIPNLPHVDFRIILHKNHLSIFYSVIIHFCVMVLGAIGSIFIMRAIGPHDWGIFSWMIAFSAIGSVLIVSGSGSASRIFTVQNLHLTEAIIVIRLLAIMVTAPIVFLGMYALTYNMEITRDHPYSYGLALIIFPILACNNLISDILIVKGRGLHASNLFAAEKAIYTIGAIAAVVVLEISVDSLFLIFGTCVFARLGCGLFYLRPYIRKLPSARELSETLRLGKWLGMSSYIYGLSFCYIGMAPTIFLGYTSYDYSLKYFAVAKSIVDFGMLIPVLITGYALPPLIKEWSAKGMVLSESKMMMMAFIFMLALVIPFAVVPDFAIYVAMGTDLNVAAECIRIMTVGMFSYGMMVIIQPIIASSRPNDKWSMVSPLVAVVFMTALIIYFAQGMDARTMAYIFSATYSVYFISFIAMYAWKISK